MSAPAKKSSSRSKTPSKPSQVNGRELILEHKDIDCYKITYGTHVIFSFVFKSDSPTKDAMAHIQEILVSHTRSVKSAEKFSVYIDAKTIIRPSYSIVTQQADFMTDLEKVTAGYVRNTVVIVKKVVSFVLEGAIRVSKPKTPTKIFNKRDKAWEHLTNGL
jgi:hypothetical protein